MESRLGYIIQRRYILENDRINHAPLRAMIYVEGQVWSAEHMSGNHLIEQVRQSDVFWSFQACNRACRLLNLQEDAGAMTQEQVDKNKPTAKRRAFYERDSA